MLGEQVVDLRDDVSEVARHRAWCEVRVHEHFRHRDEAEDGGEAKEPLDVFEGSQFGVEATNSIERSSANQQGLHVCKAEPLDSTCF